MSIYEVKSIRVKGQFNDIDYIYNVFKDFKGMLVPYVTDNGKTLDLDVLYATLYIDRLNDIRKPLFMIYILKYWYAYTMDIIEGKYEYVNYTPMVWSAFCRHMSR